MSDVELNVDLDLIQHGLNRLYGFKVGREGHITLRIAAHDLKKSVQSV